MIRNGQYPQKKDGSPYYWSVLLRLNENIIHSFYQKQLDEFGYVHSFNNPMRRIWVPANNEGEQKLQSLISDNIFESVYRSQGLYYSTKTHTKRGVSFFSHLWVDVDIQNTVYADEWYSMNDNEKVNFVFGHCLDLGIPMPSSVYFSGRGFYLLWNLNHFLFNFPTKRKNKGHMKRRVGEFIKLLNTKLVKKLFFLGADMMSTDYARVLRVPGSINPKTKEEVRLLHESNISYSTTDLANSLLPYSHQESLLYIEKKKEEYKEQGRIWKEKKKKYSEKKAQEILDSVRNNSNVKRKANFTYKSYTMNVISDLKTLATLRWKDGYVAKGYRDIFGHIAVSTVASISKPDHLLKDTENLIADFMPASYLMHDFEKHNSTSIRKLQAGDRYGYSIDRIIELLNITKQEMACLITLITKDMKQDRRNKRCREQTIQRNINKPLPVEKAKPWLQEGMKRTKWYELKKKREEKELKEKMLQNAIQAKKESNVFAKKFDTIDEENHCFPLIKCDIRDNKEDYSLNSS